MTTTRTGSRIKLPSDALRRCASCLVERGNRTRDWHRIADRDGQTIGWTCPACPTTAEPIRREANGDRVRWLAVVDVTPAGAAKRKQAKRRFDQLDDARAWVAEIRSGVTDAVKRGRSYRDRSRMTVQDMADQWLDRRAEEIGTPGGIREVTLNGYRSALHSLLAHLGARVARDVSTDDVESALRVLATTGGRGGRSLSHRTVTYALISLRQVFNYGIRQGWLQTNAAALAKAPRRHGQQDGGSRRAQRWTVAQLQAFRAYLDTYSDGPVFAAEPWIEVGMRLTLSGLRRSEVLGLDWTNVDRDAGTVTVAASRVKTGKGNATALGEEKTVNSRRIVHTEQLHSGTVRALRALWLAQGRPESGLVIRNAVGEPVHPDAYSRRFKTLCAEASVPYPGSIHNVRHTIATALLEAGMPDNQGAALLGHDVQTYRTFYVLSDDDAAASAAKAAGQVFGAL
ncbi:tyrosine-type recombinase/integrase [Enemella sp. A6]|uniref:tyrosine-type recombinase/integrase n=1 Tax=Enemella sp. A6 TaxID=3440152 RepID=UPI003EBFAD5F